MTNSSVRDTFIKRAKIIRTIRNWLEHRGFVEVETPILYGSSGGALANPFVTHMKAIGSDVKLRIAPELFLKVRISVLCVTTILSPFNSSTV